MPNLIRQLASAVAVIILAGGVAVAAFRLSVHKAPSPPSPASPSRPVKVRIKPMAPSVTPIAKTDQATVLSAIATIVGTVPDTSDRYEARNDALRAIARERNLSSNDVAALVSWLASTNDVQRVERLAANLSLVRLTGDLQ